MVDLIYAWAYMGAANGVGERGEIIRGLGNIFYSNLDHLEMN